MLNGAETNLTSTAWFDCPMSNLDAALRVEMRVEPAKLKVELGATIVYVTHDQTEAMVIKTDGEASPRRCDQIEIALPLARCHLFDAAGRRLSARRDAARSCHY